MDQTLLQQGVQLMLFGMGTVFIFLVVLIACTSLMSSTVLRFAPEHSRLPATGDASPQSNGTHNPHRARLIAAISAAVHQHRARRRD
ncbi:MAG: OadG family protein [Pseudomonadales bacterium]